MASPHVIATVGAAKSNCGSSAAKPRVLNCLVSTAAGESMAMARGYVERSPAREKRLLVHRRCCRCKDA